MSVFIDLFQNSLSHLESFMKGSCFLLQRYKEQCMHGEMLGHFLNKFRLDTDSKVLWFLWPSYAEPLWEVLNWCLWWCHTSFLWLKVERTRKETLMNLPLGSCSVCPNRTFSISSQIFISNKIPLQSVVQK